jgi:hypothetical protein
VLQSLKRSELGSRIAAFLLYVAVAVFGMSPVQATATQFITNGNFTATSLSSPGGYICKSGTTCVSNVTSWTSTCNNNTCGSGPTAASLLFAGTNGSAFNGNNGLWGTVPDAPGGGNTIAIDGDPTYGASLSQTISGLLIGSTYTVDFEQAAAQQKGTSGATTERWAVTFGTSTQDSTLMNDPSHGVQAWNAQSLTFVATSTSEILKFLAVGTPGGEPPVVLLGDVSLTGPSVPEPATWAMMLVGLAMTGAAMRRRMVRTSSQTA